MNHTSLKQAVEDRRPSLANTDQHSALYKRVTLRLVPFLVLCYVIAYLDRINVGFAKLQMQEALNFSDVVYGLGAGIFFIGYFLFEVPSNMLMKRIGAKLTLARIMICWGIVGCSMAFVSNATHFYILRFLLGVFEAGFFPGVVYYLSCWYPETRRGKILGLFMTGFPIAGLIGGPVSAWAMTSLNNAANMAGWQWLYIVEAAPAILLGVVTLFLLDDDFNGAKWLNETERNILRLELQPEQERNQRNGKNAFANVVQDPKVYIMAFAYFTFICGTYAISFWLPTVLKSAGVTSISEIGWMSAIPYGLSALGMVILCRSSDHRLERRWHTAGAGAVGAIALLLLPISGQSLPLIIFLLVVAAIGIFSSLPLFWSIPSDYFAGSSSAAAGIAFINSLGLIGGFVSPFAIGWLKSWTGNLDSGLYLMTALILLGAFTLLIGIPARSKKRT